MVRSFIVKKKNKNIKGISLLEALVSTAIIGIGFVAILQMTNYSVQSITTSGERTKANFLINMIAEDAIANRSTGITLENFSEYVITDLQTDDNSLSSFCKKKTDPTGNSGNIYGGFDKTTAIERYGERTASKMKLNKWKSILNTKDYMNCKGLNETREFQIFKVAPSWSQYKDENYINNNITDEVLYIGKILFKLNDGNKFKSLYFQSDYKLKGHKVITEDQQNSPLNENEQDGDGS